MTRAERARDLFFEGCNCAQAVFLAFAEDRMDRDTALKIASGYGGGMAGMRGVCGAVNGMFMAYGLLRGSADPNDRAAKTAETTLARYLSVIDSYARDFSRRHPAAVDPFSLIVTYQTLRQLAG